jgi:uncharacterized protein YjiS (DUF1127 family)
MSVRNLFDHAGSTHSPVPAGILANAFAQVVETVLGWQERAAQRHNLSQLNDALLKDIGVSRADVEGEISKPFWRA